IKLAVAIVPVGIPQNEIRFRIKKLQHLRKLNNYLCQM
ncbi:MAG: hypothetical protein RL363_268, partial [Bacteroidota bacterium]